jgi:ligand-binding sensor domain-containing protein
MKTGRFSILLVLFLISLLTTQGISAQTRERQLEPEPAEDVLWTLWDSEIYALVDDGDVIWVAGGNGLVRLDKATYDYTRWSTGDGLPHRRVFAGAVNGEDRWFGGDSGLSKLDGAGEWTHYNTENSGLFSDEVAGIAVSTGGDIWTSHVGSAKISRMQPDGSWLLYPNRESAVSLAFETVKQTININELWTVAGDEVWIGYDVYDGNQWLNRRPEGATIAPQVTRADSQNHVFALDDDTVFEWNGGQWTDPYKPSDSHSLSSLAVDKEDVVWVGGLTFINPYVPYSAAVGSLPEEPGEFYLEDILWDYEPVTLLLATAEGLWASGGNWLSPPEGAWPHFNDVPNLSWFWGVLPHNDAGIWILGPDGELQAFDDRGTVTKRDDIFEPYGQGSITTAYGLAGNGDLWMGTASITHGFLFLNNPMRIHQGQIIEYELPEKDAAIREIFAEDATHTWFTYSKTDMYDYTDESGIWSLDDGGTPADLGDDVWTTYDTGDLSVGMPAARDGQLWYGNDDGVFAYREDSWEQISDVKVEALIPAKDGVLFVAYQPSYSYWQSALMVEADGSQQWRSASDLVENDLALVRSTTAPNNLWHVAPDGVVWYWDKYAPAGRRLMSYDGQTLRSYTSPLEKGRITVDRNNHLWMTDGGNLWRMSPKPDFQLSTGAGSWLMEANDSRDFGVKVLSVEGFAEAVELSVSGLPAGITADIQPAEVLPGETAVVTLNSSGASLGSETVKIRGVSGDLQHEENKTLRIFEKLYEMVAPVVVGR